LNELKTNVKP